MKNRDQFKEALDLMYMWDDGTKITHIRELHKHIQNLYDELDKVESAASKENYLEIIADSLGEISQTLKYTERNFDGIGGEIHGIRSSLDHFVRYGIQIRDHEV